MRDYTKIVAWQKSDDLTVAIYSATSDFPRHELYALTSQMRRAAYSVPSNIVEGATRDSKKDYLHFLYMARGSLVETRYFLHLAGRLGYLSETRQQPLVTQAEEALRILAGLIRSVEAETGKISRVLAGTTSLLVMGIVSLLGQKV